jgi:hypothetical protein
VDVPWLVGIGVLSPLLVFGAAWLVTSGALATAVTWVRTVALPAIGRGIAAGWRWVIGQAVRLWGWVRTTAAPTVWRVVSVPFRWAAQQATRLWNWVRNPTAAKAAGDWLRRYAIPFDLIIRAIEEFVKGSFLEGLLFMLAATFVQTLSKANPLVLLIVAPILAVLKGLYSRYKDDIHRWLSQWFPWLPKLP